MARSAGCDEGCGDERVAGKSRRIIRRGLTIRYLNRSPQRHKEHKEFKSNRILCALCVFVVLLSRIACLTPGNDELRLEIYKVVDLITDWILYKSYGTQPFQYASR